MVFTFLNNLWLRLKKIAGWVSHWVIRQSWRILHRQSSGKFFTKLLAYIWKKGHIVHFSYCCFHVFLYKLIDLFVVFSVFHIASQFLTFLIVLTLWPKIRISGLSGYPNPKLQIRIIRISVLSVLFGYPNYPDIRVIRVPVLSGYPNYPGIRIILISELSGYSSYPGIRIRISDYHEITDCI